MNLIENNKTFSDSMMPGCFAGSTLTAAGIKNALIIFHGIAGCNIEAVHFRSDQIPGGHYVPVIPTGLDENDCINGATDKLLRTLRDTISQAKAKNRIPDVVFIFTSDATSIIGDDIHLAARTVEEETGVNILALDTPGFEGGIAKGVDLALSSIIERFSSAESDKNSSVNIVAPYIMGSNNWNNDIDEMIRLMQAAGININLNLARNISLSEFNNLSKAKLNYIVSAEELSDFETLSGNFGVKTFDLTLPLPVGIANTEEWLLSFATEYGNIEQAKEILVNDQKFIQSQLRFNYNFSWMSTLMHNKYASILAPAKYGASLARCLFWDFGIIPCVVGLTAETDRAMDQAIELLKPLEGSVNITVLKNPTYYEYINAAKEAKVDFAVGSAQDKPLCLGANIPHLSLCGYNFFNQFNFVPYPNFGIRGVLSLLSALSKVMEDAFYMKDKMIGHNYRERSE